MIIKISSIDLYFTTGQVFERTNSSFLFFSFLWSLVHTRTASVSGMRVVVCAGDALVASAVVAAVATTTDPTPPPPFSASTFGGDLVAAMAFTGEIFGVAVVAAATDVNLVSVLTVHSCCVQIIHALFVSKEGLFCACSSAN